VCAHATHVPYPAPASAARCTLRPLHVANGRCAGSLDLPALAKAKRTDGPQTLNPRAVLCDVRHAQFRFSQSPPALPACSLVSCGPTQSTNTVHRERVHRPTQRRSRASSRDGGRQPRREAVQRRRGDHVRRVRWRSLRWIDRAASPAPPLTATRRRRAGGQQLATVPPPPAVKRFTRQQVPDEVVHDAALNEAASVLPSNYNFEIHKTVWRVRQEGAKCVALQFPEGLLMYACVIADIMERFAGARSWVHAASPGGGYLHEAAWAPSSAMRPVTPPPPHTHPHPHTQAWSTAW
jgi:hypothetical protein